MCSVHVRVAMHSNLGQRPAFIQHIAGLAVVHALTKMEGYQVCIILTVMNWESQGNIYLPHPKDGEGTIFTAVCLSTGG